VLLPPTRRVALQALQADKCLQAAVRRSVLHIVGLQICFFCTLRLIFLTVITNEPSGNFLVAADIASSGQLVLIDLRYYFYKLLTRSLFLDSATSI
jgi:hypothetical protein